MISVCIILYNNEPFISRFFKSLVTAVEKNWEIIFWDNNSKDKTARLLEKLIEKYSGTNAIRLIKNNSNRGYAGGVNESVRIAKYNDILLINPNSIVSKDDLAKLRNFYKQHQNVIVAGRYVDYEGGLNTQPSAVRSTSYFSCMLQLTNLGKMLPFLSFANAFWETETKEEKEVAGVSAGFTFFSKKLFQKLHGFDNRFFLYLEDLDFCIRARSAGYAVYFYPQAKLRHFGGGSSITKKNRYRKQHWRQSRDRFFKKHFSPWQYSLFKMIDGFERLAGLI